MAKKCKNCGASLYVIEKPCSSCNGTTHQWADPNADGHKMIIGHCYSCRNSQGKPHNPRKPGYWEEVRCPNCGFIGNRLWYENLKYGFQDDPDF